MGSILTPKRRSAKQSDNEVLQDLRAALADWGRTVVIANRMHVEMRGVPQYPAGNYRLQVMLHNDSPSTVRGYCVSVEFPREFIRSTSHALFAPDSGNPNAVVFRRTPDSGGFRILYPGDVIEVVSFEFSALHDDPACLNAMDKEAVV